MKKRATGCGGDKSSLHGQQWRPDSIRTKRLQSAEREDDPRRRCDAALVLSKASREAGETRQYVIHFYRPETKVFAEFVVKAATYPHGKSIF